MKSFKYFDLNNSGFVEPEEFSKAIEKIGIMIPTKQVSTSCRFAAHPLASVLEFATFGAQIFFIST